jgi:hypothetical protein
VTGAAKATTARIRAETDVAVSLALSLLIHIGVCVGRGEHPFCAVYVSAHLTIRFKQTLGDGVHKTGQPE